MEDAITQANELAQAGYRWNVNTLSIPAFFDKLESS
jgi:hypothetical protein